MPELVNVSNSAGLISAIASATPGSTILLAPGDYGLVKLTDRDPAGPVTIMSADSLHPATMSYLELTRSSNLNFQDIDINIRQNSLGIYLNQSDNIHFSDMNIHGDANADYSTDGGGITINKSTNISVADSEIHDAGAGIGHVDSTGLSFTGNYIHNIRSDGISGGGSSNVTISGNLFSDFFPPPTAHPDAIQFWTFNTSTSAHDITITDNVFARGNGGIAQGVFMGNENDIPFLNVTIKGNAVLGGMYNGIYVSDATGATVTDNFVVGYKDMTSWIEMKNTTSSTVSNNITTYLFPVGGTNLTNIANKVVAAAAPGDTSSLTQWLSSHPGAEMAYAKLATTSASEAGDVLRGAFFGGDTINGAGGDDTIVSSSGYNVLNGGEGNDQIVGGLGFDAINGNQGNDTVSGGSGDDWVLGGKDNDLLDGGVGNDIVNGNLGSDTVTGGAGDDVVRGGQGNDSLSGGAGNDWLSGDRDADTISGGAGADTFHSFADAGMDRVLDFNLAEGDRVVLDPGTLYSTSQVGSDVVISMSGAQLVLVNVSLASLFGDWISYG